MRGPWFGVCLILIVTGCGGGNLTVPDHAAEVEDLVAELEARFAALDSDWESQSPSLAGALDYWERRLEIRGRR